MEKPLQNIGLVCGVENGKVLKNEQVYRGTEARIERTSHILFQNVAPVKVARILISCSPDCPV